MVAGALPGPHRRCLPGSSGEAGAEERAPAAPPGSPPAWGTLGTLAPRPVRKPKGRAASLCEPIAKQSSPGPKIGIFRFVFFYSGHALYPQTA